MQNFNGDGEEDEASALASAILKCRACAAFLPLEPKPVLQWHPNAAILVVGQAPGIRAHETGTPFNDPSGDRLRDWMGVSRDEFYNAQKIALLPMAFCYPGRGKSGDLPPRPECAILWRHQLMAQLRNVKMTLLLGEYAQRWYWPQSADKTLQQRVANWRQTFPQLIPMPHPSPRNNLWLARNSWFEAEVVPAVKSTVRQILQSN